MAAFADDDDAAAVDAILKEAPTSKIPELLEEASKRGLDVRSDDLARALDEADPLREYRQQFEVLLDEFVAEAGCTTDEFLAAAQEAEGINEFYVKIFLSHAEYSMFVEMMGQEALRQAAENDLSGES